MLTKLDTGIKESFFTCSSIISDYWKTWPSVKHLSKNFQKIYLVAHSHWMKDIFGRARFNFSKTAYFLPFPMSNIAASVCDINVLHLVPMGKNEFGKGQFLVSLPLFSKSEK